MASASVDLPAPDRPVNQRTTPSLFLDIDQAPCCADSRYEADRMAATSGREYSGGGASPRVKSSRTRVPDRTSRSFSSCGQVLIEATPWHARHQKLCSKKSVWIASSPGTSVSK